MCLRILFWFWTNSYQFLLLHLAPPCSSLLLSAPELLRSRSGAAPEQLLHFCLLIWWLYVCCSGAAPLWLLRPWISEGEKELLRSQMRSSPPNFPTDYPRGTGNSEIVAYHYHGTTQTIKTSYFRPVCHETKIRLVNSDYKNYLIWTKTLNVEHLDWLPSDEN